MHVDRRGRSLGGLSECLRAGRLEVGDWQGLKDSTEVHLREAGGFLLSGVGTGCRLWLRGLQTQQGDSVLFFGFAGMKMRLRATRGQNREGEVWY